ncbi:MAG: helix-turn-helix domain-containing protein [Candidatus Helarchaeota archaeon]|nr:helix-turn-helix domain-containing protein [Candidatus Helarchaeota archaeon]
MFKESESLLTVREAAAALRVHPAHVYRLISRRKIVHYKVPGVGIRFRPADLEGMVDGSRRGGDSPVNPRRSKKR